MGIPIKASDFYSKPTLSNLNERFAANETARQPHKARTKNAIDIAIIRQPNLSLEALMKALAKEGINTIIRQK